MAKPRLFKGKDGCWHRRWDEPLPPGPVRAAGRNSRALGTNPRAKGTNPRAQQDPKVAILRAVLLHMGDKDGHR
jgi:hypothetical protein